ncbi:hypothetical protein Tco_1152919 [Tanacetum coccineum]
MESLSEVSEYLNNLEGIMKEDEVNFVERMEELVKNWKPRLWKGMISCTMSQKGLSHMTIVLFEKLGKRKFDVDKYGRRIVTNAQIEIHGLGEMQINIGELQDDKYVDWLLKQMLKECGDEGVGTWEMIKIGKANRLKNKNKDSKEHNPPLPPPTPTQKKPNSTDSPLLPLPNEPLQPLSPMKMLDEVSIDKKRLEMKEEIVEEEVAKIIEEGLPKKMDDLENYVVTLKVNGTTPINALADIEASVSVKPYKLYKVLGLGKACPSNDKLLMADNTVARSYGKQRDVEVADLKAMLERSEAEAAEVVELRKRVSDLEAMVAVKTGEVANLNTQNAGLLEKGCDRARFCRPAAELDARIADVRRDMDNDLYPNMLAAIGGRRWVIGHGFLLDICGKLEGG